MRTDAHIFTSLYIKFHFPPTDPCYWCPLDLSGMRVDYFAWHFNCGRPWQSSTGFHTIHPVSVCSCTAGRTLPSLFVSCLAREGSGPSQCSLCAPDGLSVIPSPLSRSRTAPEILSVFLSLSFSLSVFLYNFPSVLCNISFIYIWQMSLLRHNKGPSCLTSRRMQ